MAEMTPKSSRLQKRLLVASLALNLVIVGLVAGTFFLGETKGPPQRFDLTAGPMTRAMDVDRRDALRDALRASGAFQPADRTQLRADARALLTAVRAETFDDAAFRAALERQQARLDRGQDAVLDAVTQQISEMTPQERNAFADRLEEQMRRPPQRQPRGE